MGNNLNSSSALSQFDIKEEDQLRADMYSFLANMIRTEPSQELLDSVKKLTGDDSSIGKSIKLISKLASTMHISEIQDEYVNFQTCLLLFLKSKQRNVRPSNMARSKSLSSKIND